jgi:hypothetical protein
MTTSSWEAGIRAPNGGDLINEGGPDLDSNRHCTTALAV